MNLMTSNISHAIVPLRQSLLTHRLYAEFKSLEQLQVFMEHHVFAVWDFMSLLKALQRGVTCVTTPWMPVGEPRLRRLVNEIVLGEESDITENGEALSHFELYLRAMKEVGADTLRIELFLSSLRSGNSLDEAFNLVKVPDCVRLFVSHTFDIIASDNLHEIASAFTYGREDLIPEMFTAMVTRLDRELPGRMTILRYYLQRHIELDGDEHGAMGREMVELICADDQVKQNQSGTAAAEALKARIALWDGIADRITSNNCV